MLPALLLVATLVVVGLLVIVLFRMGARLDALRSELERLRVVQRDMSSDVRARLDEGARTWESVEAEVRPRLDQLEPSVADLSATLDEHLPALSDGHKRLEAVEARTTETEARVVRALETGAEEQEERFDRVEAAVRTLRNAADERLADLAARVSTLETQTEPEADPDVDDPVAFELDAANGDVEGEDEPQLVAVSSPSPERSSRGTRRGPKPRGGRWMLVMLVLAGAAVIVVMALDPWG